MVELPPGGADEFDRGGWLVRCGVQDFAAVACLVCFGGRSPTFDDEHSSAVYWSLELDSGCSTIRVVLLKRNLVIVRNLGGWLIHVESWLRHESLD
jgi:hypothetical protein